MNQKKFLSLLYFIKKSHKTVLQLKNYVNNANFQ